MLHFNRVVLAIMGHGTCGKTTASKYIRRHSTMRYNHSTSEVAKMHIELPGDHGDRAKYRVAWGQAIADFNNQDEGIKLYKLMAEDHDIFDGIRRVDELMKMSEWFQNHDHLVIPIWIDRDVPDDPSCEIRPEHCKFSVRNRRGLLGFYCNLDVLLHGVESLR